MFNSCAVLMNSTLTTVGSSPFTCIRRSPHGTEKLRIIQGFCRPEGAAAWQCPARKSASGCSMVHLFVFPIGSSLAGCNAPGTVIDERCAKMRAVTPR